MSIVPIPVADRVGSKLDGKPRRRARRSYVQDRTLALTHRYDAGNAEAAAIILADPERYAGLPLEWARLWVANHPSPKLNRLSPSSSEDFENNFFALAQKASGL